LFVVALQSAHVEKHSVVNAHFCGYNASPLADIPHNKSFFLSGTNKLPYNGNPNVRFIGKQGDTNLYELLQK
jgi:hypothetical protein